MQSAHTHKFPLELALVAARRLGWAVVQAHVQVVVGRHALTKVGGPRPEVGERRLGERAGLSAAALLRLVVSLHVVLQSPQLP